MRREQKSFQIIIFISLAVIALLSFTAFAPQTLTTGGSNQAEPVAEYTKLEQRKGKKLGTLAGTVFDQMVKETGPDATVVYLNTVADLGIALEEGKMDAYLSEEPIARVANAGGSQVGQFFSSIQQSFEKNFIREDRWKMMLNGTGITLIISISAAVFGTILGFAVCMLRRMKNWVLCNCASVFIRVVQGTPIVVSLMLLYYVVFGSLSIDAIVVAIIGFSINFAAYTSEMLRSGIDAVDSGQWEAAYALGFSRARLFFKIILPQAARHFLPVFKGEFISMVKMTSVVGYIAIQDLTKVSDIIRSRTYEAFFPLIATAIIYFVIAYLLTLILNLIEFKVDPQKRKRVLRGGLAGTK